MRGEKPFENEPAAENEKVCEVLGRNDVPGASLETEIPGLTEKRKSMTPEAQCAFDDRLGRIEEILVSLKEDQVAGKKAQIEALRRTSVALFFLIATGVFCIASLPKNLLLLQSLSFAGTATIGFLSLGALKVLIDSNEKSLRVLTGSEGEKSSNPKNQKDKDQKDTEDQKPTQNEVLREGQRVS